MDIDKNKLKEHFANCLSHKVLVAIATIGVWILVLQNFGVIPISQNVVVTNRVSVKGDVDAQVRGYVTVDNTVDVNLAEINGYRNCFYNNYTKHPKEYYRIPVCEY